MATGHRIGANGTLTLDGVRSITGFLPSATGTIAVSVDGTEIVAATTATAGVYIPLPLSIKNTVTVTLASNAAGALFV